MQDQRTDLRSGHGRQLITPTGEVPTTLAADAPPLVTVPVASVRLLPYIPRMTRAEVATKLGLPLSSQSYHDNIVNRQLSVYRPNNAVLELTRDGGGVGERHGKVDGRRRPCCGFVCVTYRDHLTGRSMGKEAIRRSFRSGDRRLIPAIRARPCRSN